MLEARRNPKGLGALEEKRLLAGGYAFPELKDLSKDEGDVLLDSAALLFLEHNVCFRDTDPLRNEPYLVFPELINLKKPPEDETAPRGGRGLHCDRPDRERVCLARRAARLHAQFTRTSQWQNNARYEVVDGLVCGFRQEAERDGELDFVLCFSPNVGCLCGHSFRGCSRASSPANLTVQRYEPVRCTNMSCCRVLDRSVLRQRI